MDHQEFIMSRNIDSAFEELCKINNEKSIPNRRHYMRVNVTSGMHRDVFIKHVIECADDNLKNTPQQNLDYIYTISQTYKDVMDSCLVIEYSKINNIQYKKQHNMSGVVGKFFLFFWRS